MKKLKCVVAGMAVLSGFLAAGSVFAGTVSCVETSRGQFCGEVSYHQDSILTHYSFGIDHFTLNGNIYGVPAKYFSGREVCEKLISNLYPLVTRIRPALPFGLAVQTERKVSRWTQYSNGDCRPSYARYLKEVDCLSNPHER